MCQWLGTEAEGERWLRGRALKVGTSAVGSGVCYAEVLELVHTDVEVDMPRRRTM